MAADRFDRVQQLFHRASEMEPAARRAFLANECGDDAEMRLELEALLAETSDPLDLEGIVKAEVDAASAGRRRTAPADFEPEIGPYRVVRQIGEGGFALVYLAEQRTPIRRTVALKVLKAGMDSRAVLARFDSESQALAVMDHPNIARVLDGGMTPAGRPYFAMDYVRGVPINEYADRERLTLQERLGLFLEVCDAVQHAHQKGIIHRDLKPANILVEMLDGRPVAKVIDFGIAKAIGAQLTDLTLATEHGQLIGTPGYMSPEQAGLTGLDIDTRADVYSLGVVLYELLVGTLPIDTASASSVGDLQRRLCDRVPPRPSTRLTAIGAASDIAARRRTQAPALRRAVRGELDWIAMRALEKERARRYDGVSELSADVRRFLADEPVLAGPPTMRYRLAKFISRHRVPTASAAVVFLAIAAAAAISVISAMRAHEQQLRSEAVSDFLQQYILSTDPFDGEAGSSETDTLVAQLDYAVLEVGEALGMYPAAEAQVRSNLAWAYFRHDELEKAEVQARRAHTLAVAAVGADDFLTLEAMNRLGLFLHRQSRDDEVRETLAECVDRTRRVLGPDHDLTLSAANNLAMTLKYMGQYEEAERLHRDVLERRRRTLGSSHEFTLLSAGNLGQLLRETGRASEAVPLLREVMAGHEAHYGPEHPHTLISADQLGQTLRTVGELDEAAALHRRAYDGFRAALGDTHSDTLGARMLLAQVLDLQGAHAEAESEFAAVHAICLERYGPVHSYTLASGSRLTRSLRNRGALAEAEAIMRPAYEGAIAEYGWDSARMWATARDYAQLLQDAGDHERAISVWMRTREHAAKRIAPGDARLVGIDVAIAQSTLAREPDDANAEALGALIAPLLGTDGARSELVQRGLEALVAYYEGAGDAAKADEHRSSLTPLPPSPRANGG